MKVGCDIDGVICNTALAMQTFAKNRFGCKLDFQEYHPMLDGVPIDEETLIGIIQVVLDSSYTIKPYPGAVEYLPLISQYIGPITFITARDERYTEATADWINKHFPFSYTLVHKGSSEKAEWVKAQGLGCLIEDRLRTANHAAEIGLNAYLIARPWNKGRELHEKVKRFGSFGSLYKDLLKIKGVKWK